MKQACSLLKSSDSISLQMKNHYKQMIPLIINGLSLTNGKKSFFKFFNQIYDQLTKQTSNDDVNDQILFSIHTQIQSLKSQIDFLPNLNPNITSNSPFINQNKLQKSLSATKFNMKTVTNQSKTFQQEDDYMGFAKPLSRQQKSVNNIKKMIQNQKLSKQNSQKGSAGLNKKISTRNYLKNQPNPYQLNLYADQKPQCQFM